MATPTFIQDTRIGRTIYQIREGALSITTTHFGRLSGERRIELRSLNPDYQPYSIRLYSLLIIPLIMVLVCAAVIWNLLKLNDVPGGAVVYMYMWPVVWLIGSLILLFNGIRRVEYFRFFNHWHKPVVDIIREKKQEAECASFILTLVANIEIAQSGLQPEAKAQLLQNLVHDHADAPHADLGPDRWITSIILGGLAVVIPLIPAVNYYVAEMVFPFVFMLSLGGMCFSVYSFISKEPKRWWSAIGFILSLIPPYFY